MENSQALEIVKDVRQTPEYSEYIREIGWKVEEVDGVRIFIRKLGPLAIAKIQRVKLPLPIEKIRPVLKASRVIMCKLEPLPKQSDSDMEIIKKLGFRQDKWPLLPSKTLRLDICRSMTDIEAAFKKDARYCLAKARKSGIEVKLGDWDLFYDIWKKAAKNKKIWILPKHTLIALRDSFRDNAVCVTAGKMSGVVILVSSGVGYYYFSATIPEAKQFQLPYRMVWEGINESKKRGAKVWDFEGIYDSRWPISGWKGFTHFKKSFGGQIIEFPGSFVRWGLW